MTIFSLLKKQALRTSLLLIIYIFLILFMAVSLVLRDSAQEGKDQLLSTIGSYIQIEPNHELLQQQLENNENISEEETYGEPPEPHSEQVIHSLAEIDHITGYVPNDDSSYWQCVPRNFSNSKTHTGVSPVGQEAQFLNDETEIYANSISLHGVPQSILNHEDFQMGYSQITDGELPTQSNRGLAINEVLARENQLKIGDELEFTLYDSYEKKLLSTAKLPITAIYKSTLHFEILPENVFGMAVYRFSPYNRVYIDYSALCEIAGINEEYTYMRIYVDDMNNIPQVISDVEKLSIDWTEYSVVNAMEQRYLIYGEAIETAFTNSESLITFSLFSTLMLAILLALLWNKNESYELGVYLVLGKRYRDIARDKIIENSLLAVCALILALPLGYLILYVFQNLVPSTGDLLSSAISSFDTGARLLSSSLSLVVKLRTILVMLIFALLTALLFSVNQIRLLLTKTPIAVIEATIEE